jgi:hypothetical protein
MATIPENAIKAALTTQATNVLAPLFFAARLGE